jgi:hypothetical protein
MRRRLALLVPALLTIVLSVPAAAQANMRLGGFLGFQFDNEEDWLIFGAEGRFRTNTMQFDVQPRFHYRSFDGGSESQLDGNILFNFRSLVAQVQPYMGLGAALNRISIDEEVPGADLDETNVGVNLVSGLIFGTNPTWRPYTQFEYTIINDFGNRANIAVGILFQLSGRFSSQSRALKR